MRTQTNSLRYNQHSRSAPLSAVTGNKTVIYLARRQKFEIGGSPARPVLEVTSET